MSKLNFAEMNKVVLGAVIVLALVCVAFMLQTLIDMLTKSELEENFDKRASTIATAPSEQQEQEPETDAPAARPMEKKAPPPSVIVKAKSGIDMDLIIENKKIQHTQIQYLRANSKEKGGGPDALSEKEIDEMERKGLMIQ